MQTDLKVEHITDDRTGISNMQVTLDKRSTNSLIRKGMTQAMHMIQEQFGITPEADTILEEVRTYCLTNNEAQMLIQLGVLSSLQTGINEHTDNLDTYNAKNQFSVSSDGFIDDDFVEVDMSGDFINYY